MTSAKVLRKKEKQASFSRFSEEQGREKCVEIGEIVSRWFPALVARKIEKKKRIFYCNAEKLKLFLEVRK